MAAAELVESYEEFRFNDENVRREAKYDIKWVVRRLKMLAKRTSVPSWRVPTGVLIMSPSPGCYFVREQERRGLGCPEIQAARYRLWWQFLSEVHIHVRRREKSTDC